MTLSRAVSTGGSVSGSHLQLWPLLLLPCALCGETGDSGHALCLPARSEICILLMIGSQLETNPFPPISLLPSSEVSRYIRQAVLGLNITLETDTVSEARMSRYRVAVVALVVVLMLLSGESWYISVCFCSSYLHIFKVILENSQLKDLNEYIQMFICVFSCREYGYWKNNTALRQAEWNLSGNLPPNTSLSWIRSLYGRGFVSSDAQKQQINKYCIFVCSWN